jgi:PAS domain S-box-containing protein
VRRIVLGYGIFSLVWILLSDRLVKLLLSRDPALMMLASSAKGLVFVLVTSLLLYTLLRRNLRQELAASEQLFASIFRLGPDAVDLTLLDSGMFVDLNQRFEQLFGYPRAELIGRSTLPGDLDLWVEPGDRDRLVAELRQHGLVHGFRAPMRRRDGSVFTAMISSALLELRGRPHNLVLTRDITEQMRAEAALRESSQRLDLATASANLGVWDRNMVDRTLIWNDRMYELYGLRREPGVPDYDLWYRNIVHPDDLAHADAEVAAAMAGDKPYEIDFRAVHPDGSIRHITSCALIQRDAQGRAIRIIGINRDRTPQVEAAAQQHRLLLELQHAEKLESLGSLAGGVAHDMNNVLAAIMGMASALRATASDRDSWTRPMDTIIRACTRGRDVVKSLLYFARKDLETMVPVNLNLIAQEVLHLLSYTTLQRVRVSTELQEPLGLIEGDAGALSHALINLCVNAVDAMPEGGTLLVRTRAWADAGVEIAIRDSGIGMTPELARRAIEPFFTTKPMGKGTGLGLAMVYGTVMAHKGSLEIHSEPGQGTEVVLRFPRLAGAEAEARAEAGPGPASAPLRILLVDDDPLIIQSVGPMLAFLGHQVHTAEAGQEALDRIQAGLVVDLVILDMNMPGLNGAETLTRLLALRPDQGVLMATGYSDAAIAPLLDGRPRVGSLRKPFTLDELRAKLEAVPGSGPDPV